MNFRKSIALLIFLSITFDANASSSDNWETFSDIGAYGLVATALAIPAYKDDWEGFRQAGFSVVTASGVGLLGKSQIDAERPDESDNDSFPSNHTANAFAAATTMNRRYGWEIGLPAYGIAALVGTGRVRANKHYWRDVFGGAALGTLSGWIFTDSYDEKIQIMTWAGHKEVGLTLSIKW